LYQYVKRTDQNQIPADFELIAKVKEIHKTRDKDTYGSRRMAHELRTAGYVVGRYRARSLMKRAKVVAASAKRFKKTTDSKHRLPVAPNLLERQFVAAAPDRVWCADITYLWTLQGWLYVAIIIDLFSRKIVGWAMSSRMAASLVEEALKMAYWRRKPAAGLMHHSDRGSQYAALDYQRLLSGYGMRCSMSRKGDCWDNAVAESFFHTLKADRTSRVIYTSRQEARADVIDYIEMFYNSQRLHSTLGYVSPNEFERIQNRSLVA